MVCIGQCSQASHLAQASAAEFAKALGTANGCEKPQSFNGYYFKILTKKAPKAKLKTTLWMAR